MEDSKKDIERIDDLVGESGEASRESPVLQQAGGARQRVTNGAGGSRGRGRKTSTAGGEGGGLSRDALGEVLFNMTYPILNRFFSRRDIRMSSHTVVHLMTSPKYIAVIFGCCLLLSIALMYGTGYVLYHFHHTVFFLRMSGFDGAIVPPDPRSEGTHAILTRGDECWTPSFFDGPCSGIFSQWPTQTAPLWQHTWKDSNFDMEWHDQWQQPSKLMIKGLLARPFWSNSEFDFAHSASSQLHALQEDFSAVAFYEHRFDLSDSVEGFSRSFFRLAINGHMCEENSLRVPNTRRFLAENGLDSFPAGMATYMVMRPATHIVRKFGPNNFRIRCHLVLHAPLGEWARIRVADEVRVLSEGDLVCFDDSFDHEYWNEGNTVLSLLSWDVWHPTLTSTHRMAIRSGLLVDFTPSDC